MRTTTHLKGILLLYMCQFTCVATTTTNSPHNASGANISRYHYNMPPLRKEFSYIIATCFLIIIIISVTCNFVLITTIISVRKLHNYMHVYIINMAVSDLITALGTIPFDANYMLTGGFPCGVIECGILHTTFLISLPSSVLSLTLVTAERFISIVFPLETIITKKKVIASLIFTWNYTLLVGFFPMMYDQNAVVTKNCACFLRFPIGYQYFQVIVNFAIPILFIIGVYIKLFKISYRQANKTAWITEKIGKLHYTLIKKTKKKEKFMQPLRKASRHVVSSLSRNMKASKRIAMLVGVFLFCWLTYIIVVAMNVSCLSCYPRELTWVANVINYSSTAINPLLYGLMNKTIRREVLIRFKGFRYIKKFYEDSLKRDCSTANL